MLDKIVNHRHNFSVEWNAGGGWIGISGSSFSPYGYEDIPTPTYLDLSTVVCDYCGNRYLVEIFKSEKITNCSGCGGAQFHFERK